MKAERPDQPISGKPGATGNLRDPACRHPAVELELPEPVLRVAKPLTEPQVPSSPRVNVRHSPAVAQNLNLMIEARQTQCAPVRRQGTPHQSIPSAQRGSTDDRSEPGACEGTAKRHDLAQAALWRDRRLAASRATFSPTVPHGRWISVSQLGDLAPLGGELFEVSLHREYCRRMELGWNVIPRQLQQPRP